jgi:hypothetical protein
VKLRRWKCFHRLSRRIPAREAEKKSEFSEAVARARNEFAKSDLDEIERVFQPRLKRGLKRTVWDLNFLKSA